MYSSLLDTLIDVVDEALSPFVEKLAREALINSTNFAVEVWPLIFEARGIWLGAKFVGFSNCIWTASGGQTSELWAILQRLCSEVDRPIFVLDEALTALLGGHLILASIRTCCLKGSTDANGVIAGPLPYPTDDEKLLYQVLPELLEDDSMLLEEDEDAQEFYQAYDILPHEHRFSERVIACYEAIAAAVTAFDRSKRWEIPVPSASLHLKKLVVDSRLNKWTDREAANLLVLPDEARWPVSTKLLVRDHYEEETHVGEAFAKSCLHPALAPLFATLADSQSVGLESPRHYIQRNLQSCLASEAQYTDGSLWPLIAELYERPLDALTATPSVASSVPRIFSETNNWEILLWAAIECAFFHPL